MLVEKNIVLNNNMTMMMLEGFQDCSICRRDWIEPGQKNSRCAGNLDGDDDDRLYVHCNAGPYTMSLCVC